MESLAACIETSIINLKSADGKTKAIDMAKYGISDASMLEGEQLTTFGIEVMTDMNDEMCEAFEADMDTIFPFYSQIGAFTINK